MSNYICTIYSHEASFDLVTNETKNLFPDAEWLYERRGEFTDAIIVIKGRPFQTKEEAKNYLPRKRRIFSHVDTGNLPSNFQLARHEKNG